jgi:hypothetical protein
MQVSGPTLNPALSPALSQTRGAEPARAPAPQAEPAARAELQPNVVDISPIARARSQLVRAGDAGNVDFAQPIKAVVGEGEPNAELRARVLGLIVGVLTDRRISARRAQHAEARQAATREAIAHDAEVRAAELAEARQRAEAEGPPARALQMEPAGLRFPSADAYDESDEGVLAIAGRLETADGAQVSFSASVAVDSTVRGEVNLPAAVEKMSVQARLPFGGGADAIDQRRFNFTVTAGEGAGPVADRLRVWEHTDTSTSLAAVGLPGEGTVVLPPTTGASESAA